MAPKGKIFTLKEKIEAIKYSKETNKTARKIAKTCWYWKITSMGHIKKEK